MMLISNAGFAALVVVGRIGVELAEADADAEDEAAMEAEAYAEIEATEEAEADAEIEAPSLSSFTTFPSDFAEITPPSASIDVDTDRPAPYKETVSATYGGMPGSC